LHGSDPWIWTFVVDARKYRVKKSLAGEFTTKINMENILMEIE
jgi:hypothetical protein